MSWIDWIADLVVRLSPLFTLGGVVWLFFAQRRTDAQRTDKAERTKLYRSFIAQIQHCTKVWQNERNDQWHLDPEIRKLWSIQGEIELIGSQTATAASAAVVVAVNDLFIGESPTVISSDGTERVRWDNVAFESKQLLATLKKDLEK